MKQGLHASTEWNMANNGLTDVILTQGVSLRTNLNIDSTKLAGVDSWHFSSDLTMQICNKSISLERKNDQLLKLVQFSFSFYFWYIRFRYLTRIVFVPSPIGVARLERLFPWVCLSQMVDNRKGWSSYKRWYRLCVDRSIRALSLRWTMQFGRPLCGTQSSTNSWKFSQMFVFLQFPPFLNMAQALLWNFPCNQWQLHVCHNICSARHKWLSQTHKSNAQIEYLLVEDGV